MTIHQIASQRVKCPDDKATYQKARLLFAATNNQMGIVMTSELLVMSWVFIFFDTTAKVVRGRATG